MTTQASPPTEWLREAEQRLAYAGVATPEADAAALALHAFGDPTSTDRSTDSTSTLTREQLAAFAALVERRCARVPIARLTGRLRFRRLELLVGPGVFLPQPETSCVVQWTVEAAERQLASGIERPVCVDLCCGAGTIALSMAAEIPNAVVHGVEVDGAALAWAARNAAQHRLNVQLHQVDAAEALPELNGQVDIVTSNPPYVAVGEMESVSPEVRNHDPGVALGAGTDGLDIIRIVEQTARRLLRPGGVVVVEHSDRQGQSAPEVFRASGHWTAISCHRDDDRLDRFVTAIRGQ